PAAGCAPLPTDLADDETAADETAADETAGAETAVAESAGDDSTVEPIAAEELESRCDIDPAAYYLAYAEGEFDSAVPTAMPSAGAPADMAESQVAGAPEPAPPIVIAPDEPGFTEDNTFVDAGESRWVTTTDDRESTFALDVDTG